ncbi:hypothetical protein M3Y94_00879300 [Aphelenchoides besseyi]|nr:hypothetical protein M3Y94_00879300 [Aphelenchoides besseyi]KAI6226572.1 hypothetical protein M3Y95_00635100 [Aphelenchoides besseyi]
MNSTAFCFLVLLLLAINTKSQNSTTDPSSTTSNDNSTVHATTTDFSNLTTTTKMPVIPTVVHRVKSLGLPAWLWVFIVTLVITLLSMSSACVSHFPFECRKKKDLINHYDPNETTFHTLQLRETQEANLLTTTPEVRGATATITYDTAEGLDSKMGNVNQQAYPMEMTAISSSLKTARESSKRVTCANPLAELEQTCKSTKSPPKPSIQTNPTAIEVSAISNSTQLSTVPLTPVPEKKQ